MKYCFDSEFGDRSVSPGFEEPKRKVLCGTKPFGECIFEKVSLVKELGEQVSDLEQEVKNLC